MSDTAPASRSAAPTLTPAVVPPAGASPPPLPNPLIELHRVAPGGGAETQAYGNVEIVTIFDVPQAEYAAIRKACGLMDLPQRGVLEIGGKDRHSFLNNFLTNLTWTKDAKGKGGTGMAPGTGVYAYLLNGKGRVVADMNVLEVPPSPSNPEGTVLLETDARLLPLLRPSLEKYVFTEKVTFKTRVGEIHELALHGPGAIGVLQEAGVVISGLPAVLGSRWISLFGVDVLLFRDDPCGVPGLHLLVPADKVAEVWTRLSKPYEGQTNKRALRPVGWAMFNACRIEAGRPLYGIDFTDQSLPAETGRFLAEHGGGVSVTKGCYLGQEVVARMYARSQVAKQLVGLRIEGDALPTEGAPLTDAQGNTVGGVTSSTLSPILGGAAIALATVKKGFTEVGTELSVPAEGAIRKARVVTLPFVA